MLRGATAAAAANTLLHQVGNGMAQLRSQDTSWGAGIGALRLSQYSGLMAVDSELISSLDHTASQTRISNLVYTNKRQLRAHTLALTES